MTGWSCQNSRSSSGKPHAHHRIARTRGRKILWRRRTRHAVVLDAAGRQRRARCPVGPHTPRVRGGVRGHRGNERHAKSDGGRAAKQLDVPHELLISPRDVRGNSPAAWQHRTGVRHTRPRLRDLALLRRVRDRIDREYARPLDVERLARGVNMSAGHLSRRFRLAYGEPPYSYLMTRRIERAMALLRRGTSSRSSARRSAPSAPASRNWSARRQAPIGIRWHTRRRGCRRASRSR
jgi:AraC-like DNA-binding protein